MKTKLPAEPATDSESAYPFALATDSPFTNTQRDRLFLLAGLIVGASEEFGLPGADDPRIFADILGSAREVLEPVQQALEFAETVVLDWDNATLYLEGRVQMAPLVSLVLQCYYRDDRVMQSLNMEPRAPFPLGYEVPEGDWSMLEPVQKRGKIWRDAKPRAKPRAKVDAGE